MSNKLSGKRREASKAKSSDYKVVKIRTEGRSATFTRKVFIYALILLQLGILLYLYLRFLLGFRIYLAIALILSLVCCVHVISTEKDGQTKAGWLLFLLLCFSFSFIIYTMSMETVFYYSARKSYDKILTQTKRYEKPNGQLQIPENIAPDVQFLKNAGGFVPYGDSPMQYFPSGTLLFDDVLEKLESAEKFIFIEFFIIADGVLLNRFSDILLKKAAEGVDVRIIADSMGSRGLLSMKTVKKFREAGIKVCSYNRILPIFTFALNLRDHRKIIVIDGKIAYTGGSNLADEYINEKRMHGYWKDTGLRVEGSAVYGISLIFLRQWSYCTHKTEDYTPFLSATDITVKDPASPVAVPYADGKDYRKSTGKGVYANMMSGARQKIYIMTPYLIPDDETMNVLATKALSGVDVRIILPGVPDKPYVYVLTIYNARKLQESGVKIYVMRHSFVHSKVMLTENSVAVGSINIDLRSYYNQFENAVFTNDKTVMAQVEQDFTETFPLCEPKVETKHFHKTFLYRIGIGFVKLFSPLM